LIFKKDWFKNKIKMTPSQYMEERRRRAEEWHIPLFSKRQWTLNDALASMSSFKLESKSIPLIIRLAENPKYDIGLFSGTMTLNEHDCSHLLLGRGVQIKDEAFVIGFVMGSTKKMKRWRRNLYLFCSKYLFPEGYKFKEEERFVFNMAIMAGERCSCDLSTVDFKKHGNLKLPVLRDKIGIDRALLKCCYEIEKKCFPNSPESQRLL
jgi:hypothetical protein